MLKNRGKWLRKQQKPCRVISGALIIRGSFLYAHSLLEPDLQFPQKKSYGAESIQSKRCYKGHFFVAPFFFHSCTFLCWVIHVRTNASFVQPIEISFDFKKNLTCNSTMR